MMLFAIWDFCGSKGIGLRETDLSLKVGMDSKKFFIFF